MDEIMDTYQRSHKFDMYDLSGLSHAITRTNKYGWMNISMRSLYMEGDEYIIKMPRVVSID